MTDTGRIAVLNTARLALQEFYADGATLLEMPYIADTIERLTRIATFMDEELPKRREAQEVRQDLTLSLDTMVKHLTELGLTEGLEADIATAQDIVRRARAV